VLVSGVTLSNGLGWAVRAAHELHRLDEARIDLLDFNEALGTVANRRPFAAIPRADGIPDVLGVDHDGGVWVALRRRARCAGSRRTGTSTDAWTCPRPR
jgi:sugar lactone lactonase YvrE